MRHRWYTMFAMDIHKIILRLRVRLRNSGVGIEESEAGYKRNAVASEVDLGGYRVTDHGRNV